MSANNMTSTDFLAWLGAITGTVALGWDVFKWAHSGANIKVSASPNMKVIPPNDDYGGLYVFVEARNVGNGKTTLTHLVGFHYGSLYKRLVRRPPDRNFIIGNPLPGPLPHVLDGGERWLGLIPQSPDIEAMASKGRLYCGVFHSNATKAVLARVIIRKKKMSGATA